MVHAHRDLALATAQAFVGSFYTQMDRSRQTLPDLYRDDVRCSWNGNAAAGRREVETLLSRLPASKHEVQSYDCHPVPGS